MSRITGSIVHLAPSRVGSKCLYKEINNEPGSSDNAMCSISIFGYGVLMVVFGPSRSSGTDRFHHC